MSRMQQFAWFNLAVISLTLLAIVSLLPFLGYGALGGIGLSGLLGFGPLFFRASPGQVIADERDQLIQLRAWFIAYNLFWVAFVFVAVGLSAMVYGEEGSVPVNVVRLSTFFGFMLMYTIASITILFQYSGEAKNAE
jgi:hypothetical protein